MKTNERLREIREHHLHHDYPQEQCQRCFLLARLDEVVKLLKMAIIDYQFSCQVGRVDPCACRDCVKKESRRVLAELEKGE